MAFDSNQLSRGQFARFLAAVGAQIGSAYSRQELLSPAAIVGSMPDLRSSTWVDVKDHGAVGDGKSDDTKALQKALSAVPARGGTVRFPAGRYLVPFGGLVCEKPISVMGDGMGTSAIVMTAGTGVCMQLDSPWSVVTDVGLLHSGDSKGVAQATGLLLRHRDFTQIHRVQIQGFATAARLLDGIYFSVVDCSFRDFSIGLELAYESSSDAGDSTVYGCTFDRTQLDTGRGGTAILWHSGGGLRFINNKINGRPERAGALQHGIRLAPSTRTSTGLAIIGGNSIECFHETGISLSSEPLGRFNNSFLVTGNEIAGYQDQGDETGIYVNDVVDGVALDGNHIYDVHRGVYIDNAINVALGGGNVLSKVKEVGIELGPTVRACSGLENVNIAAEPGGLDVVLDQRLFSAGKYKRTVSWMDVETPTNLTVLRVGCSLAAPAVIDLDVSALCHGYAAGVVRLTLLLAAERDPQVTSTPTLVFEGVDIRCLPESRDTFRVVLGCNIGDKANVVVHWCLGGAWRWVQSQPKL